MSQTKTETEMFCWQCEQTSQGTGCSTFGVCGKSPEVAKLQDLLIYSLRGFSQVVLEARKLGMKDEKTDLFIAEAAFATLTNVNFDPDSIIHYLNWTVEARESLKKKVAAAGGKTDFGSAANLALEKTIEGMVMQAKPFGIQADSTDNADLRGLHWLLTYGIKGVAAYAYHAYRLGKKDDKVFEFIEQGLASPLDKSLGVNEFVGLVFKMRRNQHPCYGTPRRRQHRNLRSPSTNKSSARRQRRAKPYLSRDTTSKTSKQS